MQRISDDWWIGLDGSYRTRVEDGSLVFWRSRAHRLDQPLEGPRRPDRPPSASPPGSPTATLGATDLYQQEDNGLLRFGYLLEEPEEARAANDSACIRTR